MHTKDELKNIREKIAGYNLFDTLSDRLKVIIKKSQRNPEGGVSDSMIYKAFRVGGKTPTAITILNAAQQLIGDHEELIEGYIKKHPPLKNCRLKRRTVCAEGGG